MWAGPDAIDPSLADCVATTPRLVATDGGVIESESDDGDVDVSADECDECAGLPDGVLCWECYQNGAAFERE